MILSLKSRVAAAAVVASFVFAANAADVTGAGASFIYPVMSKWSADYNTATGKKVNYQSIGSGGGIAQIKAATVDFGSSDAPLKPDELAASGLAQFPSVIGGVVPVVNVQGIAPGALKLDGKTLADIFLGKVKTWNDPAIVALNPGAKLPDAKITVVHRSDGSGTSFNFTNYLSKVNPDWKSKVGEGTAVQWPVGIGGKGNEGVAAYVKQIKGGIGYVELSYALQNKMAYTAMKNAAGKFVQPSDESFAAAAASADWANAKDFYMVMTNAPGEAAWPITATNFILVHKQPKNPASAKATKDFFKWVYANGDAQAKQLDYVPLPDALVKQIDAYWSANLKY
ncbi:phosphate ABC transporter substrate-binding protein PstS [Xanthomonas translucens]|uniref:phosphate ABC transporter substrate-binding protein PstS n=2 Tax=Xanthomonas campestris pv. translucens TaxID=343 RepID=UPI00071E7FC5|nr:phosphate ABC transporter substrate-binding protein PstS [Xanthomonas translucens]KWV14706.1 phosphate ABC transporter substrate-binding protein [Xanthomonas translucens]MCS3359425.1 phosphate ABC transporter substrate-binding protein PstS [Xanthomonas translucens pv. translucens]MCS3372620.1 phosphate ABC transporter substrate-binding protein PstS [Xanthomonas translucens pv. translucens]MCT8273937.1 phosphate ABC transporter substrate-binding protein PstS [Xanthomonas translucens pv. trans